METIVIDGTPRTELGKKATRALRRAGNVPCNLYGVSDSVNFYAPSSAFRKLIYTSEFRKAQINLDGKTFTAIVKDSQFDPVKEHLLHLDFQELSDNVKVKVSVPLKLKGTPKGITDGGKLEQVVRRLYIMALPKDLPSVVEMEISGMELGTILRVRDIQIPGVTFLLSQANPICSVLIPRAVVEEVVAAPVAAEGAPAAAGAAAPGADAAKADDKKGGDKKDDKKK